VARAPPSACCSPRRSAAPLGAQPRGDERELASLVGLYRAARTAQAEGRPADAEALLRNAAVRTGVGGEGTALREANARLLALRATLLATRSDAADDLFRAESYLAAAIADEPRIADHWHAYVGVRRRREGRLFDARLERRELVTYDLRAAGLSRRPLTLVFPWREDWAYLRALALGHDGRRPRRCACWPARGTAPASATWRRPSRSSACGAATPRRRGSRCAR
jgi:hypothetical protein